MSEVSVFLGGEGGNELGSWFGDHAYQNDSAPGVIKALLLRTQQDGWRIIGARTWKTCRKYTAYHRSPAGLQGLFRSDHEAQAVLGLVLDARESGARAVAFLRDEDGCPERIKPIADAIRQAREYWPEVKLVGEVAVPVLEGWILAALGETKTESMSKAKAQHLLADRGVTTTADMVKAVLSGTPLPQDATRANNWLEQARTILA
jgi:hypothetical protein